MDLHLYETLGDGRLHYGSVLNPFAFTEHELSGRGRIAELAIHCESPTFSLRNHAGYELREVDRHDVAVLCGHFGLRLPDDYR